MEVLWAPWRMKFIKNIKKGKYTCIFCEKPKEKKDKENYLLYHGRKNFVMLNLFPYNTGHIMISPYRHLDGIEKMKESEIKEHYTLIAKFLAILRKEFNPDGFNIGTNIGKASGAGFDHVHTHIVPRWNGDNNFMPVIGKTKVMPELLDETYEKIEKYLK